MHHSAAPCEKPLTAGGFITSQRLIYKWHFATSCIIGSSYLGPPDDSSRFLELANQGLTIQDRDLRKKGSSLVLLYVIRRRKFFSSASNIFNRHFLSAPKTSHILPVIFLYGAVMKLKPVKPGCMPNLAKTAPSPSTAILCLCDQTCFSGVDRQNAGAAPIHLYGLLERNLTLAALEEAGRMRVGRSQLMACACSCLHLVDDIGNARMAASLCLWLVAVFTPATTELVASGSSEPILLARTGSSVAQDDAGIDSTMALRAFCTIIVPDIRMFKATSRFLRYRQERGGTWCRFAILYCLTVDLTVEPQAKVCALSGLPHHNRTGSAR